MTPADGLEVRQVDGVRVLRVTGELDLLSAPLLEPSLLAHVDAGTALLLDLSVLTFFDSAAVRLVDHLVRRCASQEAGVRVVAPAGCPARRVLDLVAMSEGLVVETVEDGVACVRQPGQ